MTTRVYLVKAWIDDGWQRFTIDARAHCQNINNLFLKIVLTFEASGAIL